MDFVMDTETAKIVAAGRASWDELKKRDVWAEWVNVGRALQAGKAAMMQHLKLPPSPDGGSPKGKLWSKHFGAWLDETDFGEIDQGVRSRLELCMDHLAKITTWRNDSTQTKRQEFNHPNSVWRHYAAEHHIKAKNPRKKPETKAVRELVEEVKDKVVEVGDDVRSRLPKQPDDLHFDLKTPETRKESAEHFLMFYESDGLDNIIAFADLLKAMIAERRAAERKTTRAGRVAKIKTKARETRIKGKLRAKDTPDSADDRS